MRAGVEAHAERGRMRAELGDRLHELVAGAAPAHLAIGEVALVAIREAEMLAGLGDAVELVLRQVLRQPVAAVVGEVEMLGHRMPVEADRVAHADRKGLGAGAVEIEPADLRGAGHRLADVAGRADVYVELAVGPDAHIAPAVRLRCWAGRCRPRPAAAACRDCPRCSRAW